MKSMSKMPILKILSAGSVLLIFILFVLRQVFGLSEPLASKLMLFAVLAAIASVTCLGIAGYRKTLRER